MKKMIKVLGMTLIIGCSVSAFAGSGEQLGTVIGGVAGGIVGNNLGHGKPAATIGGAVIGSLVGNQVGSSADARERCSRPYYPTQWETCHTSYNVYPPRYSHAFVGRDGRLYRRSVLSNPEGDVMNVLYCCYHMSRDGFCTRWVRVN